MVVRNALRATVLFGYALIILTIVNEAQTRTIFERCDPKQGFFFAPGTGLSQCLKLMTTGAAVTWEGAKAKCSAEGGLVLARPFNALPLRQYIFERFGHSSVWVDAKSDGTEFWWQTDRAGALGQLYDNNPLLWPNIPGNKVSSSYCMVLLTSPENINDQPETAYYPYECSKTQHTLCEKVF